MNLLITRFWNGKITLWRSYWLVGELLNALFVLAIINFEIFFFSNNESSISLLFLDLSNFTLITKLVLLIWTIFITVGIWRSAENYKGNIFWIIATFLILTYRVFVLKYFF